MPTCREVSQRGRGCPGPRRRAELASPSPPARESPAPRAARPPGQPSAARRAQHRGSTGSSRPPELLCCRASGAGGRSRASVQPPLPGTWHRECGTPARGPGAGVAAPGSASCCRRGGSAGSARHGTAKHGTAQRGAARLSSARHRLALRVPEQLGAAQLGSSRHGASGHRSASPPGGHSFGERQELAGRGDRGRGGGCGRSRALFAKGKSGRAGCASLGASGSKTALWIGLRALRSGRGPGGLRLRDGIIFFPPSSLATLVKLVVPEKSH